MLLLTTSLISKIKIIPKNFNSISDTQLEKEIVTLRNIKKKLKKKLKATKEKLSKIKRLQRQRLKIAVKQTLLTQKLSLKQQ
jgi:hypothetical protein